MTSRPSISAIEEQTTVSSGPPPCISNSISLQMSAPAAATSLSSQLAATTNMSVSPEQERKITTLLGEGAYHLPENNWWQDWLQYIRNNHPFFAVCFQYKLHPIPRWMRGVGLFGSIMFGLVITNIMFIWQLNQEAEEDTTLYKLPSGEIAVYDGNTITYLDDESAVAEYTEVSSTGVVFLWTVGSLAHALFDSLIWYATSCSCCGDCNGRCGTFVEKTKRYLNVIVVIGVVLISGAATLGIVLRAMAEQDDETSMNVMTDGQSVGLQDGAELLSDKKNYEFLKAYSIELVIAWFAWWPIVEGLTFSGILSCRGRCSMLGGRPAEIKEEEEQRKQQAREREIRESNKKRQSSTSASSKRKSGGNKKVPKKQTPPPPSASIKKKAVKKSKAKQVS